MRNAPAFSVSHRGNALTLNGKAVDKEKAEGPAQEAVSGLYRVNRIKSLTFVDPPAREELFQFLNEAGGRTTEEPLERWYWTAFAADHELRRLGVAQKSIGLQQHSGLQAERARVEGRVAEARRELERARDLYREMGAVPNAERIAAEIEALTR